MTAHKVVRVDLTLTDDQGMTHLFSFDTVSNFVMSQERPHTFDEAHHFQLLKKDVSLSFKSGPEGIEIIPRIPLASEG